MTISVLLIDDSSDFRALLAQIISADPEIALTTLDPLESGMPGADFEWRSYDVLLLDRLLGTAGDGLLWLRDEGASLPLPPTILLTAAGDQYIAVKAIKWGAEDYLHKDDLSVNRLSSMIREAVGGGAPPPKASDETLEFEATMVLPREGGVPTAPRAVVNTPPPSDYSTMRGYDVLQKIGKGAMAEVFLARRQKDDLVLVLKIMNEDLIEDAQFLERFLQEADLVLQIESPYVVKIYEQAFTDEGAFIAMEYLSGGDLRGPIGQGVSNELAVDYFIQITKGLDAIHRLGIVHRDLKPANIMLREDTSLAIVDFGISQRMEKLGDMTAAGTVIGSPYYLSPEQGQGTAINPGSDLYSAGVIFYELLTGTKPFEGDSPAALIYQHIYGDRPTLPPALARYQALMDRLLAKDSADRCADANEVIQQLAACEATG